MPEVSLRERFGAQFLDAGGAIFNIRHPDFGAIGDGAAVEDRAIDAARAEGIPFFPAGRYRISEDYDIWSVPFQAAGEGVSILQGGRTYDVSGAIAGEFCVRLGQVRGEQGFLELVSARNGRRIARIANEASSSQSHRITLPLEVRRNSHALIMQPEEPDGHTDILWRTARSSDVFQLDALTLAGAERLVLLVDTRPGNPDGSRKEDYGFDEAISIPGNDPRKPIELRSLDLLLRRQLRLWARVRGNEIAPGDVEVRFAPSRTGLAVIVRELASEQDRTCLEFSAEELSVRGFSYPALERPYHEEGPSTPGSGTHRFSLPVLDAAAVPYRKPFYRHVDGNAGGYLKLVVTIGHANARSSGVVMREYTYAGARLAELGDRAVDTVAGNALTARLQKTGDRLEVYVDAPARGGFQINGFVEWCMSRHA